jgi:micrococcal nuclease
MRQQVIVRQIEKDRYGRVVAEIFLPGGASLNRKLVEEGLAWWYRQYAPRDLQLRLLEERARDARRGLWVDPRPVPPWKWRGANRRK